MRTLTYQEMMFVGGGKEDIAEPPPKAEQSPTPNEQEEAELFRAAMRCSVSVARAKKAPTIVNLMSAAYECTDASKKAAAYVGRRTGLGR